MKQFNRFAAVLVSALLLLSLAACGDKPDNKPDTSGASDTSAPTDPAQSAAEFENTVMIADMGSIGD